MGRDGLRKSAVVALLLAPLLALSWLLGVSRCGVAGVERDWEANLLLKVCARLGHVDAEAFLGMLYISSADDLEGANLESGLSEEDARKHGWDLLRSAAGKKGGGAAAGEIGVAFLKGLYGAKKDVQEARKWIARATRDGDEIAPLNFARIYAGGLGVQPDLETALTFLTISADRGYRPAQCYLSEWKEISNEVSDTTDSLEQMRTLLENDRASICSPNDPVSKLFRLSKRSIDQVAYWARSTYRNMEMERRTNERLKMAKGPDQESCAVYRDLFSTAAGGMTLYLRPDTLSYPPFVGGDAIAAPRMFYRETGEYETIDLGGGESYERPVAEEFEFDTSSMFKAVISDQVYSVQECFSDGSSSVNFWFGSFDSLYTRHKSSSDDGDMRVTSVMLWQVSPVGFSEDGEYALIYTEHICGRLCGAGGFYLLKRDEMSGWVIYGYLLEWIS